MITRKSLYFQNLGNISNIQVKEEISMKKLKYLKLMILKKNYP